jgi:dTDP-glucose 4,6-dehydratase
MPRALVTGGVGFLGSHLCDRLIAEGFEVVAIDNLVTGSLDNVSHLTNEPRFSYENQDVSEGLTYSGDLDFVFHFASPASPVDFARIPLEIMRVNSRGTEMALELARIKGATFLFSSTSEVYGDPLVHPQTEEYRGNVNTLGVRGVYDESKRYGESITMAYRRLHNVNTKLVRIFNTYGPRMRLDDGRVVPNFIRQALTEEPITVYGEGTQTRSFCYCADLIDGIFRLANSDQSGPINVGNPTERTMLEFAQEIKALTQSKSEIVYRPMITEDDPKQRRPDISKAKALLGWEPKVSLQDGLRETIAYFQGRLDRVKQ